MTVSYGREYTTSKQRRDDRLVRGVVAIAKGRGMRGKPKAVNPHEIRTKATVRYGMREVSIRRGWHGS